MAKEYKWGYVDKEGRMVIPAQFDGAWDFHEGLAAVKIEWARGYIDKTGATVIVPQYQYAGPFEDGKALVQLDGRWGYITKKGEWMDADFAERDNPAHCEPIADADRLPAELVYSEGLAVAMKRNKAGYVNEAGEFVIAPQFKQAKPFSEGLAAVLVGL